MYKTFFYIQSKSLVNFHFILELWDIYKKYASEYKEFDFRISIAINGEDDKKGPLPITFLSETVKDNTNLQSLFVEKLNEWCKLNGSQQNRITSIDLFIFAYSEKKEKLDQFSELSDFYQNYCRIITLTLAQKNKYIPLQLVWYVVVKRILVIKVYQQEIYKWFRDSTKKN